MIHRANSMISSPKKSLICLTRDKIAYHHQSNVPPNQFCTPVMTAVTVRLMDRPTLFSSMTFCFHIQWKKSARAMGRRREDPGSATMLAGRPRELCPGQLGEAGSRTSHKSQDRTYPDTYRAEGGRVWKVVDVETSRSSRLQQTKVLLKLRWSREKKEFKMNQVLFIAANLHAILI